MKRLKYIYAFLVAMLLGFAISSCEDDEEAVGKKVDEGVVEEGSGEMISTTFTVGISAPNVDGDLDVSTRAGGDNANIEYAKPGNGGRFQNLIVVLTNQEGIIKGVEFKNWGDGVGVKEYIAIFPDIQVPATDVTAKKQYKVYAFGNVCKQHYDELEGQANNKTNTNLTSWNDFEKHCINLTLEAENLYDLDFTPGTKHYSKKNDKKYYVNTTKTGGTDQVECTGMPVNNSATATVVKGNTQFDVAMKRVCARLQVTFRNFTGKTDYDDTYYGTGSKGNRVYVDNFVLKGVLATSTNYFYNGSTPSSTGSVDFDILQALGGSNDHKINMIENGEDLVVSMYVFETIGNLSKTENRVTTKYYTYDLKVDRGKSLGNRVESLVDDNVYILWSDNLDPGNYKNDFNRCLGADANSNIIDNSRDLQMDDEKCKIPFGIYSASNPYGNRIFWHYNSGMFDNCNVDLNTDFCTPTKKYISTSNLNKLQDSGTKFTVRTEYFDELSRSLLEHNKTLLYTIMISNNELKSRNFTIYRYRKEKSCYPWVFFAKYIIKNGETFKDNSGPITQIDRNHSYELDFSVMPNYDTKQEILVNCVRKQNEVNWSEVQK